MAQLFSEAFDQRKDDVKKFTIELHSPGGSVDEGERVIKIMRKMAQSHSVWTYVGPKEDCLSMCVPIYLQGELRVAAATSQWMFHEPGAIDPLTGNAAFSYEFEKRQTSLEVFNRYFKQSEMDSEWRKRLQRNIRNGEVWKSGQDLKDEESNIISLIE